MVKNKETITPIRKQYLDIKRDYPDTILFFRLGDFYETFDEDAQTTSKVLDIVLTSRNVAKGERVPMAGIPYHAMESYLGKLIDQGYHVAICEQVSDQPVKGLMPRKVVRVVTPGTVVEEGLLETESNNYLASIIIQKDRAGIAFIDITTGEFSATELAGKDIDNVLRAELIRLKPAEVLYPEDFKITENYPGYKTSLPTWRYETNRCESEILEHFKVSTLDGFGIRGFPLAIRAAGVIIQYLNETQQLALNLVTGLSKYSISDFMTLDAATLRNLELMETIRHGDVNGSLLGVLDYAITPMGKRMLRQWVSKPLLDLAKIEERLDGVEFFFGVGILRAEFRSSLRDINDLERLANRILGKSAQPRDLIAMLNTLELLPSIKDLFPKDLKEFSRIFDEYDPCSKELDLLKSAINDDPPARLGKTGIIRPEFSAELDNVMASSRHAREWIANLESVEKARTGIKTLKVGFNKVFGYYIEVSKGSTGLVPDDYIRKQTLVNAERYITPEMKEYEALVLNAEERVKEIERRLFDEVCLQLAGSANRLINTARAIGELDVLASLAESASMNDYVRPSVSVKDVLEIKKGRHPVVEHTLEGGHRFIPNDTIFEVGERLRIITGPNMSGKSTFLRQVALIVLMAQMGSFVPAESANIGLVDRIFTRIGAQDEIHAGQSTFMVEMVEAANILNHATNRSLIILDEIGRGTSTYDGVSIAWAMVEYIHNHPDLRSKTLFATHYHELTELSDLLPGVRNYNVAVSDSEGDVVFLYTIVPGGADKSYGIHVAKLAGLPKPVVQRADEILQKLEESSGRAVKIDPNLPKQMNLFPETNPLLDELKKIDLNTLSPLDALSRLYEWQKRFLDDQ
jgi:DNA mismatch repair protein MutS